MELDSILYLIFNTLGFVSLFISIFLVNKKYKVLSFEYLVYSYMLFIMGFIIFAKVFHVIMSFETLSNIMDSMVEFLKFIFSGYTFLGGIIGGVLALFLFSQISDVKFKSILLLYAPSMILMYSIMKIGCFFMGCCQGINGIKIQLVESLLNMIGYFVIIRFLNTKNTLIYYSGLLFGILRFGVSFFRVYPNIISFMFVQIICYGLVFWGLYGLIYEKSNKKKEKLCKKG